MNATLTTEIKAKKKRMKKTKNNSEGIYLMIIYYNKQAIIKLHKTEKKKNIQKKNIRKLFSLLILVNIFFLLVS